MSRPQYSFVFLGLSITSSWANGHATTYRSLLRELALRGHRVVFLERDLPLHRKSRDLERPGYARTELYGSFDELCDRFTAEVRDADLAIVGSHVPDGARVLELVLRESRGKKAFYDLDTPVTLGRLADGSNTYIDAAQIQKVDLYLSSTGGPTLRAVESRYQAKRARALFASADPAIYHPESSPPAWDLGYFGAYREDRQSSVNALLAEPARRLADMRFVVAGAQYPDRLEWPANVERIEHLPAARHRAFYGSQRFTLNVTRREMVRAGYSPSVRMFEAAACATPIISDAWPGIESFFAPGREVLLAKDAGGVAACLCNVGERQRVEIGRRARERVLAQHMPEHRAEALESYTEELFAAGRPRSFRGLDLVEPRARRATRRHAEALAIRS